MRFEKRPAVAGSNQQLQGAFIIVTKYMRFSVYILTNFIVAG